MFAYVYCKILFLDPPKHFGLQLDSLTSLIKAFKTISSFLSFKGLTQAYLVKASITLNRYLKRLFSEDNHPILAKSAA